LIRRYCNNWRAPYNSIAQTFNKAMDIGVLGEGEETFSEIIREYDKNNLTESTLGKIPGIIFWKRGKIQKTEKRPLIRPSIRSLLQLEIY